MPKSSRKSSRFGASVGSFSATERVLAFFEIMRPMEWSKSLLNMLVAMLMAFYVYQSGVSLAVFVAGFVAVVLLWSGLYTLNDYTDWKIDALHEIKKKRPIPSGKISPSTALLFSSALLVLAFIIAFALQNFLLVVCLGVMLVNQYLYTMKPFRFKSRKGLDLVSGSMVNPLFRYLSGLVLFVPPAALFSQITPLLPLVFVIGIQFSGYSLYRLFSKHHDKRVKMKSTVALVPERRVKRFSYVVIMIAGLAYILMFINYCTFKVEALGFLPKQYLLPIGVALLFLPFMKTAIFNPVNANMSGNYRVLYTMTMVFILANIVVFLLFP